MPKRKWWKILLRVSTAILVLFFCFITVALAEETSSTSTSTVRRCEESDQGNDKYTFGKNTLYNSDGTVFTTTEDYCKDDNTVTEITCNGSQWDVTYESCGSGYMCSNGYCLPSRNTSNNVRTCAETDRGNNKYSKGKNTLYNSDGTVYTTTEDYCKDDNTVTEITCNGSQWDVTYESCGSGYKCSNGGCLQTQTTTTRTCTETDRGNNEYTKGKNTLYNSDGSVFTTTEDYCKDRATVMEITCNGEQWDVAEVNCGEGYGCVSGACVYMQQTSISCSETDGGLNYDSKGVTTGKDEVTGKYDGYSDSCGASVGEEGKVSGEYVAEKHCSGTTSNPYVHTRWYKCPYGCSSGVCKVKSVTTETSGSLTVLSLTKMKALNPTVIDFENMSVDTASGYWGKYGIKFTAEKSKAIYVNDYNRGGKTSSGQWSIFNDAVWPNIGNNDPLKITFKDGVTAVGFYLGNGHAYGWQVTATIKAYGANNNLLGTIVRDDVEKYVSTFVGFKAGERIYSVTIDYGDTTLSEEMDDLMFYPAVVGSGSSSGSTSDTASGQGAADGNKNSTCYNLSGKGYLAKGWSDPKVWYVDSGYKYWFTGEEVFFSWFTGFGTVRIVKQTTLDALITGTDVCLKGSTNGESISSSGGAGTSASTDGESSMSCGDSSGGNGLYSMCKGDSIHYTGGIKITNNAYTNTVLYIVASGLENTYYRVPFNGKIEVQSAGSRAKYTLAYEQISNKYGAFLRIESNGTNPSTGGESTAPTSDSSGGTILNNVSVSVVPYDDTLSNNEKADFTIKVVTGGLQLSKTNLYVNRNLAIACGANPCIYAGGPYLSANDYYPAKIPYYAEAVFTDGSKKTSETKYLTIGSGDGGTGYYTDSVKPTVNMAAGSKYVAAQGTYAGGYSIKMNAVATDDSGSIAKINLYYYKASDLSGSPAWSCPKSASPYTCVEQQGTLDYGTKYQYYAEAYDAAGNKAVSEVKNLDVPAR